MNPYIDLNDIALFIFPTFLQRCVDNPRYTVDMAAADSFRAALAFDEVRRENEEN